MIQSAIPNDCLKHLLQASRQQPSLDLWVQRLRDLLQVGLQDENSSAPVLLTDACHQQLKELCQKARPPSSRQSGLERKLSWYVKRAESSLVVPSGSASDTESQIGKNKAVIEETPSPKEKRSCLEVSELDIELSEPCTVKQEASLGNALVKETSGNEDIHSLNKDQSSQKEEKVERSGASQRSQQDTIAEIPDYIKVLTQFLIFLFPL